MTKRSWQGTLSPKQLVDGRVYIQIQRRVSGHWRTYKTFSTPVRTGASAWKVRFSIGKAGRFRLRVRHGDADHRLGYSAWRYVRVK